jgi:hypothetical protein
MAVAGATGAAAAYVWMMLAHDRPLTPGFIIPQTLLGLSFAMLVAPLTACVMSIVAQADEGLASGGGPHRAACRRRRCRRPGGADVRLPDRACYGGRPVARRRGGSGRIHC